MVGANLIKNTLMQMKNSVRHGFTREPRLESEGSSANKVSFNGICPFSFEPLRMIIFIFLYLLHWCIFLQAVGNVSVDFCGNFINPKICRIGLYEVLIKL